MTAQTDSIPSPERRPETRDDPAPSNAPGRRFRARPLAIAYASLFMVLGALVAVIAYAGSATGGRPLIALKVSPFPSASDANRSASAASFGTTRESGGNLIADPQLIENSLLGPLPRIAPGGRTPMSAYARKVDGTDKRPKIAIVLRGLGVGAANTNLALSALAPEVTLGFVPFAADLQSEVDKARGAGHEVLIEVPMEPFDFPDSDPGPHALLTGASVEENAKRLDWALSRATGYLGAMNLLGGRLMGEAAAIEPVLGETARRGLLFFDNGASSSSVAITAARHMKAAIATGTLTLDLVQTQASIDAKLAELESAARQDGSAIGVASAYSVSIARVADWAANASARGFQLVPISALARQPATLASSE